jgi:hypothetical protein
MNGKKKKVRRAFAASPAINVNGTRVNGYLSSLRIELASDFVPHFRIEWVVERTIAPSRW